ncbi:hypothetical protein [Mycobacterium sp.]|uniref:DUF7159 family protein n=1 Tax=Mycobacterium sp. TaxID=1785 RepID=UPI0025D9E8C0|nr:hypothetical protein [Mycobacterium sp.]
MDTVLGVSMAPTAVRMVLVEGENGGGVTVDEDNFEVPAEDDAATIAAADRVVSAILGTREGAAEGGYQLASTGVAFTDPIEAAALRDALAAHKVENVMLVSAFLAAAALAQTVGNQTNYARTALLYIEPDTATLAVVDTADGSIVDVHRQPLPSDDETAVMQLTSLVSGAEALEAHPDAVFVVGSGVDVPMIMSALESATTLPLTAPEEPETALARGAALASANAPLFAASTGAMAYAQDPGTGFIDPAAVAPGYFEATTDAGSGGLAYSALPDDFGDAYADEAGVPPVTGAGYRGRRSFWLVGSGVAAIFIVGMAALVVSLAVAIRPTAGVRPGPQHPVVAPSQAAPPPAAPAPTPVAPAPEPPPAADLPTPAPAQAPEVPAAIPEAPPPVQTPRAPAYVPPQPVYVPSQPVYVPPPPVAAPSPLPAAPAPDPCGRGPLHRCHPFQPH